MIMEDFCFYWSHRALNMEMIYTYTHKIHHENIYVVTISREFSRPLEFILGNVLTTNMGTLILGKEFIFLHWRLG